MNLIKEFANQRKLITSNKMKLTSKQTGMNSYSMRST